MKKIIIIGGGISGLASAYYAKSLIQRENLSAKVVLIEKESRLGGTICTLRDKDCIIEGGPDCFLSEKPWALLLARELGVTHRISGTNEANKGTYILSKGKLHPLPDGVMLMVPTRILPLLTSSLLSWRGKVRMGLDLFIPKLKEEKDESLAEFVERRLGKEALEKIAEPLVAGVHAGVPETMSLASAFPRFKGLEEEYGSLIRGMLARMKKLKGTQKKTVDEYTMFVTFQDGLGEFVEHIKAELDDNEIITGRKAISLSSSGEEWTVNFENGEKISANAVIIASPAFIAGDILREVDNQLSEELQAIPYVSTGTASMLFDESRVPPLKGFGFVVPRSEGRKIMAGTWSSRKFFNRAPTGKVLLRCFFGGAYHPELLDKDENSIVDMCLEELRSIVGLKSNPESAWVFKWHRSMPQTVIGHQQRMKRIEERLSRLKGIFLAGGAYYGLGIPDCINQGKNSAEKAIKYLKSI